MSENDILSLRPNNTTIRVERTVCGKEYAMTQKLKERDISSVPSKELLHETWIRLNKELDDYIKLENNP